MDSPSTERRGRQGGRAGGASPAVVDRVTAHDSIGPNGTPEDLNDLGVAHHTRCEIEQAIGKYREALRADALFADARNNLGAAYFHRGDVDRAIEEWEEAVARNRALVQAYHNLAVGYETQGCLELAIEAWGNALKLDPRGADVYLGLGGICETLGDRQGAMENYERFLDLAKSGSDFWAGLAREKVERLRQEAGGTSGCRGERPTQGRTRLPLALA